MKALFKVAIFIIAFVPALAFSQEKVDKVSESERIGLLELTIAAGGKADSIKMCEYYISMLEKQISEYKDQIEQCANSYINESIKIIARHKYDVDGHHIVMYAEADGSLQFYIVTNIKNEKDSKNIK